MFISVTVVAYGSSDEIGVEGLELEVGEKVWEAVVGDLDEALAKGRPRMQIISAGRVPFMLKR